MREAWTGGVSPARAGRAGGEKGLDVSAGARASRVQAACPRPLPLQCPCFLRVRLCVCVFLCRPRPLLLSQP